MSETVVRHKENIGFPGAVGGREPKSLYTASTWLLEGLWASGSIKVRLMASGRSQGLRMALNEAPLF